ncbi:MAG: prepilin-type N-terminal cleavage/methylation domain-containing protein [Gemmatimonadales bacterium]|nr:prepilin-type N-terminal cleavage/methylation domain-containing protein [Gemmatimonadales bacterium]
MTRSDGFTLIELMIVIVIIGILSSIAIPNFIRMRDNAKEAKVKGYVHTVQLVAEDHAVRNDGHYSDAAADLQPLLPGGALLENAFTQAITEPQFGAAAVTTGQVGIMVLMQAMDPVGYTVTGFGKDNLILTIQSGD